MNSLAFKVKPVRRSEVPPRFDSASDDVSDKEPAG